MASFNIELNSRANKDGLYSIFVRFTENRKSRKVKLKFRIPKEHFNKNAKFGKWIRLANSKNKAYNSEIEEAIDALKLKYSTITKLSLSPLEFINSELPIAGNASIKVYFDKYLDQLKAEAAVGYVKKVGFILRRFEKYFNGDTLMSAITPSNIAEYKEYLFKNGLIASSLNIDLSRIRRVFSLALSDDTIAVDPFRAYTPSKEQATKRTRLLDVDIQKLAETNLKLGKGKDWLHHVRNYYLFSYYNAGIRISDLVQLRQCNIVGDRLEYEMDKTGHKKSIKLNKFALQILDEYFDPSALPHAYLFPVLKTSEDYSKFISFSEKWNMDYQLRERLYHHLVAANFKVNKYLGRLWAQLEMPDLTFHTSRHSYADKARRAMKNSKKITIVDIQNSLGHKRISTTQRYWESFDKESLDDAMNDIFK